MEANLSIALSVRALRTPFSCPLLVSWYKQATNDILLARFLSCQELDPILPFSGPPRHRCVPMYSSVMEPGLVLPP